jgi:prepilin signal peptidase PulO-like enzyme (type II secretory pathway)
MGIDASLAIAFALAVWGCGATRLARAAERRISERSLPAPWLELSAVATLAACAPLASSNAVDGIARGSVCVALCAAARSDGRTGYLFDVVTFPTALLVAILEIVCGDTPRAGLGVLLLIGIFGPVSILSRGALMGLGDVKAMYAIGAAFGPTLAAFALFAASLSGLTRAALSRPPVRGLPFGPHLAVGACVAFLASEPLARGFLGGAS